jgi:hypothetical protein
LVAGILLLLLPFVSKPFHVDDPIFLWSAQHIREHPLDFYGFEVNYYYILSQPMALANQNPPLTGFYLACISLFAGWSERALHLGMVLPAMAAALGTWRLAGRFCAPPLLSAMALLSLPGFLVSATTLMPDVLATAFWCGAVLLWMEGLARDRVVLFAGAALLAGACVLTKYVGLGLIPLFLVHGAVARRRPGIWLAVPVAVGLVAFAYGIYVNSLYGIHPFSMATSYALARRGQAGGTAISQTLIGLAFLGGSALTVVFLMPWLWTWRQIAGFVAVGGLFAILIVPHPLPESQDERRQLIAHLAVFVCLGVQIAGLVVRRLVRDRSPESLLLALWIAGIFVFSAYANWSTNVRSLVPALPAVAILLLGETRRSATTPDASGHLLVPLGIGVAIALVIVHADYALACTTRSASQDLAEAARSWDGPARFEGTWGFQQYMESEGIRKLNFREARIDPGTLIVKPRSDQIAPPPPDPTTFVVVETRQYPVAGLASTLSLERGSGFYSDHLGPVPFVFGRTPPEQYVLLKIVRPISLSVTP